MLSEIFTRAENYINAHTRVLGIAVAICGLLWRLCYAHDIYLSPDESIYYTVATHPWHGWIGFYLNAVLEPHPPLLIPILQGMLLLGHSEWVLRIVPIIAGSFFPWFVMLWLKRFAGNAPALAAQLLLTFSPSLIVLSTEVRAYTLALLFTSISLLLLEESLDRKSVSYMVWYHLFLYLAILSEYGVAWFVAALGAYAALRFLRRLEPSALLGVWAVGQAGAFGLYLFLFLTHIGKISRPVQEGMYNTWLQSCFPEQHQNLVIFALRGTFRQFLFLFQIRWLARLAALAFTYGLYKLSRGKFASRAILLVLPFCAACLGAIFHLFPYGASRHTSILAISIAAGVGIATVGLTKARMMPILILTLPTIVLWNALSTDQLFSIPRYRHHLSAMHQAVDFLDKGVPAGSAIVTDQGTDLMLGYYLGCPDHGYYHESDAAIRMRSCRDMRLVVCPTFQFSGLSELREMLLHVRAKYRFEGQLWVAAGGYNIGIRNPAADSRPFGETMSIFRDSDISNTFSSQNSH